MSLHPAPDTAKEVAGKSIGRFGLAYITGIVIMHYNLYKTAKSGKFVPDVEDTHWETPILIKDEANGDGADITIKAKIIFAFRPLK